MEYSSRSGYLLRKQFHLFATEVVTNPLPKLLSGQKPSGLDNGTLSVDPLRFNFVEPRTFGGQPARNNVHPCFAGLNFLQHGLIVLAQPGFDLLTHVPGSIIPNQHEHLLALCLDLFAYPHQKVRRDLADWAS